MENTAYSDGLVTLSLDAFRCSGVVLTADGSYQEVYLRLWTHRLVVQAQTGVRTAERVKVDSTSLWIVTKIGKLRDESKK